MNPYINAFRLPKFRTLFLLSMIGAFLLNAFALRHNIVVPLLIYATLIAEAARCIFHYYHRSRELLKIWGVTHLLVILALILQII